jgi:hypothetical protein
VSERASEEGALLGVSGKGGGKGVMLMVVL